jgi:ABC-type Co2+ transport system permease subunit
MSDFSFDGSEILVRFFKYAFEGVIVATAAYFIPQKKSDPEEILIIALVAAATFAVLDLFAPSISASARFGAGAGIGANLVGGFGSPGLNFR